MATIESRWKTEEQIAERIVNEGLFIPSVSAHSAEDERMTGLWKPLWGDPEVIELWASYRGEVNAVADPECEEARRRIETEVDRLVRGRLGEQARKEAYEALHPRYGVPHTPLEHWVAGLLSGEKASGSGLDWIAEDMEAWTAAVETSRQTAPYRVAFRLREPQEAVPGTAWLLEPGLQPDDEPGRFIPAEAVWAHPSPDPVFRRRRYPAAQQRLAAGLAVAAAVFPPLLRAAPAHAPKSCRLTPEEAAALLEHAGHALETDGFAVIVPAWWNRPAPLGVAVRVLEPETPAATPPPAPASGSSLGLSALLSYRNELTLFGTAVTDEAIEQLITGPLPMAQYGGSWFRLSAKEKDAIRRFASRERTGKATWAELIQTGLLQAEANPAKPKRRSLDGDLPVSGIFANEQLLSYINSLRALLSGKIGIAGTGAETERRTDLLPQPEAFQGTLRDYQRRGFTWLMQLRRLGFGACLADDMGLGKTVQWIAYALQTQQERDRNRDKKPLLLMCPTTVLGNWMRELERFAPTLSVYLHYGPERKKGASFHAHAAERQVVITSYSTALRDRKSFTAMQWDAITLDEAQYIKNAGTQLARFVRSLQSKHRIAMTGTPIENRLSDLWSVSEWINPGYLGSERSFRTRYAAPIERAKDDAAAEKLHTLIRPFILRRVKTDPTVIDDLPEKLELDSYCTLTKTQAEMYRATVDRLVRTLERAEGMARRGAILTAITKLKQICNEPAHAMKLPRIAKADSGKLFRLEQLLAESAESGDRCVVFSQYATMANLLKPYLEASLSVRVAAITGRTPSKEREHIIRSFQEDDDGPVILVLSLKTGGFGLNLTRANRLIHYDRWWNPAAERQATDRVFRIGQTRNVEIWKLITKGTLEEAIDKLLQEKERLVEGVVGSGEKWLTEWSDEELTRLLTLRHDIVVEDEGA
ncbi:DEAD/DEAH box helicase [Paenibacillus alkalitolerans]|uniref:DEAD/DEAH box helicase n=1 Tax=Paenibacillus alkalitolerans TaxID=2799335 RepID=UPI0018F469B5|nr:DEAD/DEAH box helicase [Paenibacillus alkalitolerans]